MKTLIIYSVESYQSYLIVNGDYSRFNGLTLDGNPGYSTLEQECADLLWNPKPGEKGWDVQMSEDISIAENKQWDKMAIITLIP